jgi:hypothetical protein
VSWVSRRLISLSLTTKSSARVTSAVGVVVDLAHDRVRLIKGLGQVPQMQQRDEGSRVGFLRAEAVG